LFVQIVQFKQHEQDIWRLTSEGTSIADHGSHEARVFDAIAKSMEGLTIDELKVIWNMFLYQFLTRQTAVGDESAKFGQAKAFRNKWIGKGDNKKFVKQVFSFIGRYLTLQIDTIQDITREELLHVLKTGTHTSALADLSKRKLIEKKKIYYFSVEKGENFSVDIKKQETDISVEMLQRFDYSSLQSNTLVVHGRVQLSNLIILMRRVYHPELAHFIRL